MSVIHFGTSFGHGVRMEIPRMCVRNMALDNNSLKTYAKKWRCLVCLTTKSIYQVGFSCTNAFDVLLRSSTPGHYRHNLDRDKQLWCKRRTDYERLCIIYLYSGRSSEYNNSPIVGCRKRIVFDRLRTSELILTAICLVFGINVWCDRIKDPSWIRWIYRKIDRCTDA